MSIPFKATVILRIVFVVFAIVAYIPVWQLFPVNYQVLNLVKDSITVNGKTPADSAKEYHITLYAKSGRNFQLRDNYLKEDFNVGDTFVVASNLLLKQVSIRKYSSTHLYPIVAHNRIGSYLLFFMAPALLTLIIWRREKYEREPSALLVLCFFLIIIVFLYYV